MSQPNATQIHPEAMATFQQRHDEGPVTMLNMLKFKPDGATTYQRYMEAVRPLLQEVGARLVYAGQPAELLTGNEAWDLVMLVQYPKRAALAAMAGSEAYRAIAHLREDALERAVLYAMDPLPDGAL